MPFLRRQKHAARGFNRLAPVYDKAAHLFFLGNINAATGHFFEAIPPNSRILILGCGTGKLLENLLRISNPAHVTCVDISSAMIERTQQQFNRLKANTNSYTLICGDENALPNTVLADVIITPFILDCFSDSTLPLCITKLQEHWKPNGLWLFSDFCTEGSSALQSRWFKNVVGFLYWSFRMAGAMSGQKLPNFDAAFAAAGLQEKQRANFLSGLIQARMLTR